MDDDEFMGLFKSDALSSSSSSKAPPPHTRKIDSERQAGFVDIGDTSQDGDELDDADGEDFPILSSSASTAAVANIYSDSPRAGIVEDYVTEGEIERRRRVAWMTLLGIVMSILVCVIMLHYLSHHESFSALPPIQHRFMSSTTSSGVRENLEQYVAGVRHTGSAGDYEMAKSIRARAIAFGIDEQCIQLEEFEVLVNEPETLKLTIDSATPEGNATRYNFLANFSAPKKTARMPFPPFHFYAKNGTATGPLVYAHYGRSEDYAALNATGVSVRDAIVLVRMGNISLPAKVLIAGRYGAAGIITYNDPMDDGAGRGKPYPEGPWRVSEEASYGSVYMGNGDPSSPDGFSSSSTTERISVDEMFSPLNTYNVMPQIISMPVSAQVASSLLRTVKIDNIANMSLVNASQVFSTWNGGGLNAPYIVGASTVNITIENKNKYSIKRAWNVLITLRGSREADRYVIVGALRDSLNAGAASPGSGNAVFLEVLRGLGELLLTGWVPHRTLVLASFDGEQFGSIGSSQWIDRHFTHLGDSGVVYLRMRDVIRGAGPLRAEAAASVRKNLILMTTNVAQPITPLNVDAFFASSTEPKSSASAPRRVLAHTSPHGGVTIEAPASPKVSTDSADDSSDVAVLPLNSTFGHEVLPDSGDSVYAYWLEAERKVNPAARLPHIKLPGADYRISPYLGRLGIPSIELGFDGGYFGVENSRNDSIDWVKRFADPTFSFHRAAAQLYGSIMLAFSTSMFVPYDFTEVARDLRYGEAYLADLAQRYDLVLPLSRLSDAITHFELAALAVIKEIDLMSSEMVNLFSGELVIDLKRVREMNTRLLMTEKAFVVPAGLPNLPWLKHALYGNSEHEDYRVVLFPGVSHEIHNRNFIHSKHELIRLCVTIEQAAEVLSTPLL